MEDALPSRLALPKLRYPIGSEPNNTISINQHSMVAYIQTVKDILRNDDEFNRLRETFLGPVIKLGESSLKLSAKIVHTILTKGIKTVKKNEAWFHFGAQPMRFSIREFHMVTGLKCSGGVEAPREETERFKWKFLEGTSHTVKDVEKQLRSTRRDASDERFCLGMLLLIEGILLQKSASDGDTTFDMEYVKIAQDVDVMMTYPWGRKAYELLLKSLQKAVDKKLEKNKYDLQGFPMAFLLWILESVPLLQYRFSKVVHILADQPSTPIFLCEKYIEVQSPRLIDVLDYEHMVNLKVTCILPPIRHDPEPDVCIEDEADKNLDDIANLAKRGYKFKISDWRNRSVNLHDANEEIRRASLLFGNGGMGQAFSSSQEESLESKINRISEMVLDNFKMQNARLSLIEKDRKVIKARVAELEKQKGVTSYESPNNEAETTPLDGMASRHGEADQDQPYETADQDQTYEKPNNEASLKFED